MHLKDADNIANSEDPDQTAPVGSALFAKEQSDLGLHYLPRSSLIWVYTICQGAV